MGEPQHNSGEELQSLTDEQIASQLKGSFPPGPRWQGLTYELNRRAAEKQEKLTRRTYWAAVVAVIVGVAGVAASVAF